MLKNTKIWGKSGKNGGIRVVMPPYFRVMPPPNTLQTLGKSQKGWHKVKKRKSFYIQFIILYYIILRIIISFSEKLCLMPPND